MPPVRRFLFRHFRTVVLAVREFRADNCALRASALTFYTVLSVVPVLTMAIAIARGFGLEDLVRRHIWASLGNQTALVEQALNFAQSLLKSTTSGLVAGVGVVLLLWSVISALGSIEVAFNQIWEVGHLRRLSRRIADYLVIVLVGTVLWLVSVGLAVAIQSQLGQLGRWLPGPNLTLLVALLLRLLRFALIWLLFAGAYVILPNTRVRLAAGMFGGLWGTIIYHLVEWIYVSFQVGVASYSAIYGGFAALPLFLVWVQVTWMVVLFGAELAFARDNAETYGYGPDHARLSVRVRRLVQLQTLHRLVQAFSRGEGALSSDRLAGSIEVPIRLMRKLLREMVSAGLVNRVLAADERRTAYQPARAVEDLTIAAALAALDRAGTTPSGSETAAARVASDALARFQDALNRAPENLRLKDLLPEPPAAAASGAGA
jgi:membrane protein